ncbi:hypothetical protein Tsubulata_012213 [Turnera subulata]|uniref:Peptidase A1 domain-containing protein n=1 Tax=Turnera subulata TaxID=218843 RepID=A0A9Q0FK83_9ROSI|nr:hypothetical protein Tsubulata_012213 [Turnera subulata]
MALVGAFVARVFIVCLFLQAVRGVQTNQSESNDVGSLSFTTALFDRSSVSLNLSFNASLHALLRRDAMRVAVLTSLLCNGTSSLHLDSFGTDVVSAFIGGEYFVRVAVGTPPFSVELLVDTGSDLTWLQCQPCSHCYSQPGPIFDPRNSSTFQNVDCGLGVGGTRLPISEEVFKLRNGNGGVIIDTGTTLTRLPTIAYEALRDAYLAQTRSIPRVPPVGEFEICYNLIGVKASQLPLSPFTLMVQGERRRPVAPPLPSKSPLSSSPRAAPTAHEPPTLPPSSSATDRHRLHLHSPVPPSLELQHRQSPAGLATSPSPLSSLLT